MLRAILILLMQLMQAVQQRPVPPDGDPRDKYVGNYAPRIYAGDTLPPGRVALGRRLFFDTRLSADGKVACATCHDPAKAFTDGRAISQGIHGRTGARNTPTLVNRALGELHFWDGRAATLEQQAMMPIQDPVEMGMKIEDVLARLRSDAAYPRQFQAV